VANLDQASSPSAAPAASGEGTALLHPVPGQVVGLLLAVVWLIALALLARWARWLGAMFAPAFVYSVGFAVSLLVVYQLYFALDRLVPGTY
jgi:hypothetical protein